MKQGLIHIYCGDGKGKTTAALGLALRSAGRGFRVLLIQFLKTQETGELYSLEKIPEITVLRGKENRTVFSYQMTDEEKAQCRMVHDENLRRGITMGESGKVDLLILDEIIPAYNLNLVDRAVLLDFLRTKPGELEIVLTGSDPALELIDLAAYVSEIKKIKHPYDQGLKARIGIEV